MRNQKQNKMRTELQRIFNIKNFFKVIKTNDNHVAFAFDKPSRILMQNVHTNWLQSICVKASKHFPIYFNHKLSNVTPKIPFGVINHTSPVTDDKIYKLCLPECTPDLKTELWLNLFVPKQDIMQHFIKWQRYRKYWWSSITTTPSLFTINEIKYEDNKATVDIVAQFPWGPQTVETVSMNNTQTEYKNSSSLHCSISLEGALFTLLLDGLNYTSDPDYLRLHRKMAPYKLSFALNYHDSEHKATLNELAILLYNQLEIRKISTWLPDFSLSMDSQIKENRQMGVSYTAIVSEGTLSNGIMHLLNSSTTLKEQIHVADLNEYSTLLFQKK